MQVIAPRWCAEESLALAASTGQMVPSGAQLFAGDVTGDGRITNADAVVIMRLAAGLPLVPEAVPIEREENTQAGLVTVSAPSGLTVPQGGSLWVSISIDDAAELTGSDLILLYDSYAVVPLDVRTTSLSQNFDLEYYIPANGELRISLKPKAGYEDGLVSGSGALVEVLFEGLADAQGEVTSPLNIMVVRLSDRFGRDIAHAAYHLQRANPVQ